MIVGMTMDLLRMPQPPDTPVWQELGALADRRADLAAGLDDLVAQQRAATATADAAAAHVADLERRRLGGEDVAAGEQSKAAKDLERARAAQSQPWAERRQGHKAAIRDADVAITRFVGERFDDLLAGLTEQGVEAARAIDVAAEQVIAAYAYRAQIANTMSALANSIAMVRPGDVSYTMAEPLAKEARRLLDRGGERPPTCREPRVPRQGKLAPDPAMEDELLPTVFR
jgi:hypothetical protein